MATYIKTLQDGSGDTILPRTRAEAVTLSDGVTTLQDVADEYTTKTEYTATITDTWVGGAAPYTQAVTVNGILATDEPHIVPVYSATNSTAVLQRTAWGLIGKGVTSANTITFTCFETKPVTAIPIAIEVIR